MEGLSLPHKLLDPMAKADFDGFWVRVGQNLIRAFWHIYNKDSAEALKTFLKRKLDHKELILPLFEEEESYWTHLRQEWLNFIVLGRMLMKAKVKNILV